VIGWKRQTQCEKASEPPCSRGGFKGFLKHLLAGLPFSESATGEARIRLELPTNGALRTDNTNGRTRVIGEERGDIEIVVQKYTRAESETAAKQLLDEIQILPSRQGSDLFVEVQVPRRWNRRCCTQIEVHVPRTLRVETSSSNGKISFEGLRADLRARGSNGSVRVKDVIGDIEIQTSNAAIRCSETCGRLVARSSNGKIEISDHRGSVDACTSNGPIYADLEEINSEGVQLATSNGRIVLELPEKVDADLDLRVDNGVIRNDRELRAESNAGVGRQRGTLGRGGAPIRLQTSNGSISLR